jgi:hypothetical protein
LNKDSGKDNDNKSKESSNTRRYPRIFLTKGIQEFDRIIGIDVKWPEGIVSGVLDISYIGAALIKSSKSTEKFAKGDLVELFFSFTDGPQNVPFDAEIIREDEKTRAVYFPELSLQARQALSAFLKQKLVGLNTRLVDPKYYIKEQGFNFWFHGPNQTNVFIWEDNGQIQKATIEMNYEVLTFENGNFYHSESKKYLEVPTEDYAYRVNNPEDKKAASKKAVQDAVSLLSQITDSSGIIQKLSQSMLESLK